MYMKKKRPKENEYMRNERIRRSNNGNTMRTRVVKDNKKYDRPKENRRWKNDN